MCDLYMLVVVIVLILVIALIFVIQIRAISKLIIVKLCLLDCL